MTNDNLGNARRNKNDEFYTQYADIEKEMNAYLEYDKNVFKGKTVLLPCDDPEWSNFTIYFAQNFGRLGLKKLISTGYNAEGRGKLFTLDADINNDGKVDFADLKWEHLTGDGDFRSDEVKALRDEADFIITNPPFSLFREFLAWVTEADKKFSMIGNMNAITYKEVFPPIKDNKAWLGATATGNDLVFRVPKNAEVKESDKAKAERLGYVGDYTRLGNACWFTNIEHGRRHEELSLMTEADNIRFSKHKDVKGVGYKKYDNFDAIEVPFTIAIPSDYAGVMGVPISFLHKYNPDQFEIIGCTYDHGRPTEWDTKIKMSPIVSGVAIYKRILIRHKKKDV
jgi:hypothetical protein